MFSCFQVSEFSGFQAFKLFGFDFSGFHEIRHGDDRAI